MQIESSRRLFLRRFYLQLFYMGFRLGLLLVCASSSSSTAAAGDGVVWKAHSHFQICSQRQTDGQWDRRIASDSESMLGNCRQRNATAIGVAVAATDVVADCLWLWSLLQFVGGIPSMSMPYIDNKKHLFTQILLAFVSPHRSIFLLSLLFLSCHCICHFFVVLGVK